MKKDRGTVRLPRKGDIIGEWAVFAMMVPLLLVSLWITIPRLIGIPGIISGDFLSVQGRVKDYRYHYEGVFYGELNVEDTSGKLYGFQGIYVPNSLEIGDRVKVDYRSYSKNGVIREINRKTFLEFTNIHSGLFLFIMVFLLFSMPFYAFLVFLLGPLFDWDKDYSICVYHDWFVKTLWVVEILMLQCGAALVMAVIGKYKRFMDLYWGLLVCGNYVGILCLSYMRHKRFLLIKGAFYYRSFKQRFEGRIEEIESVERREKSIILRAKGKHIEALMKKIQVRRGKK